MSEQLYYEDVAEGEELIPLVKRPDTRQLVMWAGASGDYNPIHYDKDFAQSRGLDGVIVHGQLVYCFMSQLMTDWVGEQGSLRKLTCSYRRMSFPGEEITCRGRVTRKHVENGEHYIECNLWAENPKGERTVSGVVVVIVPSRATAVS
ncbi:MaoC/PaaZ C-terminal domain-containing protein [Chloroflexota bacterium]